MVPAIVTSALVWGLVSSLLLTPPQVGSSLAWADSLEPLTVRKAGKSNPFPSIISQKLEWP